MLTGASPCWTAPRHFEARKRSKARLARYMSAAPGTSMAAAATSAPGQPPASRPMRPARRPVLGPGAPWEMA